MEITTESMKQELWNVRSLDFTWNAKRILEKLFWLLIALSGSIWFIFFMAYQVRLWNENNIFVTRAKMTLSDIDYPAVTFCSPRANKFGIAERLGNYLDPEANVTIPFLTWLRNSASNCFEKDDKINLPTDSIGSWIVRNVQFMKSYCLDGWFYYDYFELFRDQPKNSKPSLSPYIEKYKSDCNGSVFFDEMESDCKVCIMCWKGFKNG